MDNLEYTQKLPSDNPVVVAFAKYQESDIYKSIVERGAATGDLWITFHAGWVASSSSSQNCAVA